MKFADIWNWLVDNIEVIYKIFIMLQLFILSVILIAKKNKLKGGEV